MSQLDTFVNKGKKPLYKDSNSQSRGRSGSYRGSRGYKRGGAKGYSSRSKSKGPVGVTKRKKGSSSNRSSTGTAGSETRKPFGGGRGAGGINMMPT